MSSALFRREPEVPQPPRTLQRIEAEVEAAHQELCALDFRLHQLCELHPEDHTVIFNGTRLFRVGSHTNHPDIESCLQRREELLAKWPSLLAEFSNLKS
jgi:hypothetical protein